MSEKEEHLFPQSNSYWICKKLIGNNDEKLEKKYQTLTSTYILKKDWEEEFPTLLKDMQKQKINT